MIRARSFSAVLSFPVVAVDSDICFRFLLARRHLLMLLLASTGFDAVDACPAGQSYHGRTLSASSTRNMGFDSKKMSQKRFLLIYKPLKYIYYLTYPLLKHYF